MDDDEVDASPEDILTAIGTKVTVAPTDPEKRVHVAALINGAASAQAMIKVGNPSVPLPLSQRAFKTIGGFGDRRSSHGRRRGQALAR